jgi:hypothetical protein
MAMGMPWKKVFLLQMFAQKQTFDRIFFTPRNSLRFRACLYDTGAS